MNQSGNSKSVEQLRQERDQAQANGDSAKVAQLDQQIRTAQANDTGETGTTAK